MITFVYRWKIPDGEERRFIRDWTYLTKVVKQRYGAVGATLYKSEGGDFVSIANWPSIEAWRVWREELVNHPMRQRYRAYRIAGPETLFPIVTPS